MGRAQTKAELIANANANFRKLFILIDSMPPEKQNENFNFEDRDKNLRDVLIHLYEWHQLLLNFIKANKNGDSKPFLPEPYNWKTYPKMNVEIQEKHQKLNTPLEKSKEMLEKSHSDVLQIVEDFSDEELFTKKYFSWTGTTNLGSYCISATASHYDWAIKKLKKHAKA